MELSKRRFHRACPVLMLVMALILSFLMPFQASAADNRVFEGSIELTTELNQRFSLSTSDDTLFNLEKIVPGDSWEGQVHVKNKCERTMEVSIISIVNDLKYDDLLFDALELDISIDGDEIYSGSYGKTKEPISEWYPVKSGRTITFDIKVKLPEHVGNEAQGKKMDSTWIFEARMLENIGGDPSGPSHGKVPYYVYYVDEEGNELFDTKKGYGNIGAKVTEYAESIAGYLPDAESKTIILTERDNVITFVYTKVQDPAPTEPTDPPVDPTAPSTPTTPDDPNSPNDPKPKPDDPDNIKTGDDMTEGNSGSAIWLILLFVCMIAVTVTYLRICQAKKETASKEAPKS